MAIGKDPAGGINTPDKKETRIVNAVLARLKSCDSQATSIKAKWRDNYDMFVNGSRPVDKKDWQTKFTTMKLSGSIRQAQALLVNTLTQNPRWWTLSPRNPENPIANSLAVPLRKMMAYYMEDAKFTRHAGTFFLNSLISMGALYVGWRYKVIQNPEYVLEMTKEAERKEKARLAKNVANPSAVDDILDPNNIEDSLQQAIVDLQAEATGEALPTAPKPKKYLQIGALDLQDPIHELVWWDNTAAYMEDAAWKAFEYDIPLYTLRQYGKLGFFPRSKVKRVEAKKLDPDSSRRKQIYANLTAELANEEVASILVYQGPLVIDGEIVEDDFYAVIANRAVLLKSGTNPHWEPQGQASALINASVRQIPHRAVGAGIGDNASLLQRTYDSNLQLVCDQFRFALPGLNIIDYTSVVDQSGLMEGLEPGKTIEVRGNPAQVFKHEDLSSNLENQAHPINELLRQSIDDSIGLSDLTTQGANLRSRTTAAETNAKQEVSNRTVSIISMDLEQNFLLPALQKLFARILQFGLPDLHNNPRLRTILTESELRDLTALNEGDRMDILNNYYSFKVEGFSGLHASEEKLSHVREMLADVNRNPQGPVAAQLDVPVLLKMYTRLLGMGDDEVLIKKNNPIDIITAENTALLAGHDVNIAQQDDDKIHLQYHQMAMASAAPTQQLMQHLQMHQMQQQQKEAMQQQQQQQGQRPPGPPR